MTDPIFTPEAERQLLAVYRDPASALAVRERLLHEGIPAEEIHLDERMDNVAALRAEMHQELTDAWVVPNAGVAYPKEAARGLVVLMLIGVTLGVLAAFPMALLEAGGSYWVRWIVFAVVGGAFGATVALVAGPGLGARRPDQATAAVEGTPLRVEHDSARLRKLLASMHPIRIDELTSVGDPIATVMTEGVDTAAGGAGETLRDIAENVQGDDYHVRRPRGEER